jgi:hypothetical protein
MRLRVKRQLEEIFVRLDLDLKVNHDLMRCIGISPILHSKSTHGFRFQQKRKSSVEPMEKSDFAIQVCIVRFLSDEEFLNIRLVSREWDKSVT